MSNEYIDKIYKDIFPDDAPLPDDLMRLCISFIAETKREYYDDGQIKSEENYYGGKPHGEQKTWYGNGNVEILSNYIDGKLHGEQKTWHENGNVKILVKRKFFLQIFRFY